MGAHCTEASTLEGLHLSKKPSVRLLGRGLKNPKPTARNYTPPEKGDGIKKNKLESQISCGDVEYSIGTRVNNTI